MVSPKMRASALSALAFFGTFCVLSIGYSAYVSLPSVNAWDALTASAWTQMKNDLDDLHARISGLSSTPAPVLKTVSASGDTTIPTADWGDSGLSFSITSDGKKSVLLYFTSEFVSSAAGRWIAGRFVRNGWQVWENYQMISEMAGAPDTITFSMHEVDVPPAWTHVYKLQWLGSAVSTTRVFSRRMTWLVVSE